MAERAARGRDARLGAIRAVLYEDASRQTCSGTRGACSSTRHSLDSTRLAYGKETGHEEAQEEKGQGPVRTR